MKQYQSDCETNIVGIQFAFQFESKRLNIYFYEISIADLLIKTENIVYCYNYESDQFFTFPNMDDNAFTEYLKTLYNVVINYRDTNIHFDMLKLICDIHLDYYKNIGYYYDIHTSQCIKLIEYLLHDEMCHAFFNNVQLVANELKKTC